MVMGGQNIISSAWTKWIFFEYWKNNVLSLITFPTKIRYIFQNKKKVTTNIYFCFSPSDIHETKIYLNIWGSLFHNLGGGGGWAVVS